MGPLARLPVRRRVFRRFQGIFRGAQRLWRLRPDADGKAAHHGSGCAAVSRTVADPQRREGQAGPRRLLRLVRRERQAARRRHAVSSSRGRLSPVFAVSAARLDADERDRLRRRDCDGDPRSRRAGPAGADELRGAQAHATRGYREPETVRHPALRIRRGRADGVSHRLYGGSGLRALDRPVDGRIPLGSTVRRRLRSRHHPDGR